MIVSFIRRIFGLWRRRNAGLHEIEPRDAESYDVAPHNVTLRDAESHEDELEQPTQNSHVGSIPFDADYFLRNPRPVVYLVQYGDSSVYKIGLTKNINSRLRDIRLSQPEPPSLIHCIYTNDEKWLEDFWHKRFATKRKIGSGRRKPSEWFELTDTEVEEFKKHAEWNNPDIHVRHQLSLPINEVDVADTTEARASKPEMSPTHAEYATSTSQQTAYIHINRKVTTLSSPLPASPIEETIKRVNRYFDKLIAENPDRERKLNKSRNWVLSQLETELRFWQDRGYTDTQALAKWEERAYKSADAKHTMKLLANNSVSENLPCTHWA